MERRRMRPALPDALIAFLFGRWFLDAVIPWSILFWTIGSGLPRPQTAPRADATRLDGNATDGDAPPSFIDFRHGGFLLSVAAAYNDVIARVLTTRRGIDGSGPDTRARRPGGARERPQREFVDETLTL